jgi:hypothetical protein
MNHINNMLQTRREDGVEPWAYARRFHPHSKDCPSSLDGLNSQLRELIHDAFIAIKEENGRPVFEVWRMMDPYAVPICGQKIYEWRDAAKGDPLPPGPEMFIDLIVTKKSIWRTEAEREAAKQKMYARWERQKDEAKAALVDKASAAMIEVMKTPERVYSYEGSQPA